MRKQKSTYKSKQDSVLSWSKTPTKFNFYTSSKFICYIQFCKKNNLRHSLLEQFNIWLQSPHLIQSFCQLRVRAFFHKTVRVRHV